MNRWKVSLAPIHSDIIWENFFDNKATTKCKAFLINFIVFTLVIFVVTPVFTMEILVKWQIIKYTGDIAEDLSLKEKIDEITGAELIDFFPPLILAGLNYSVLPYIINESSLYLGFKRKSQR